MEVVRGKYGEEGRWLSCSPREEYGMGLWKSLRIWGHLLSNQLSFVVGDEKRIKFWKYMWCGDTPLEVAFPFLFSLASIKEA